jgi:hypothetical protein
LGSQKPEKPPKAKAKKVKGKKVGKAKLKGKK